MFVNSPTVFRIVRGLTLDIKTRDYVSAAQTRGEGAWYIMLWEILPNARGPLIVDFCLRIGYTTILLGTLGFFGLGLDPESPNWGATINEGRKLLSIYPHPALPPAFALLSLVLGLNLPLSLYEKISIFFFALFNGYQIIYLPKSNKERIKNSIKSTGGLPSKKS